MSTLRRLLFFGILCFGLRFANGRVGKIVHERYVEAVDSNLYVNINAFWSKDNLQNLTYVACPGSDSKFQRNCTVGSRAVSLACPVTLNTDQSRIIEDYLEVFPFGPTRAIIFWGDYYGRGQRTHVKCTIVDLMTCQSNYLEFPMASKLPYDFILAKSNYVIRDNSFEFMITDNSHSNNLNKYLIDANGTLISKLNPWCITRRMMNAAYPIVIDQEIKSYLYTSSSRGLIFRQWILAKCNGTEKLLQQVNPNFFGPLIEDISTTHNTIGIATGSDSSILVGQFDLDGNSKLNMTLDFDFDLGSVSMLNLAAGGFVLTVEGTKYDADYRYKSKQLKMLKISADKKIIGSVKWMEQISCDNKITMQLFENEAKEHCLAALCTNVRRFNTGWTAGKQFAELEVRCYTDSDFTADDTL
ncbi:uncharacterized protein LOC100115743 [Nasonia vitripennis]|uniref:Uncharacterized protein n=1 Tax=Nasonia vitripennis TaxID=7425 RepID=A0A7M7LIW5_NASVI|nr:uncharacterized protein LOC100115743 [Nasonia vitripennis]